MAARTIVDANNRQPITARRTYGLTVFIVSFDTQFIEVRPPSRSGVLPVAARGRTLPAVRCICAKALDLSGQSSIKKELAAASVTSVTSLPSCQTNTDPKPSVCPSFLTLFIIVSCPSTGRLGVRAIEKQ